MIPISYYLWLGAFLFSVGLIIILTKRNIVVVLMGVELMLNAANINLVAFSQLDPDRIRGQVFVLFVLVIATAEAAVGLALLIQVYRHYRSSNLDEINQLGD